jgi:Subtilase family/Calx-beta domain/Putative binding domain, N-terminal
LTPRGAKATRALTGQTSTGEKRHRQGFVPGEALVRFKKDRAFEGQLAVPVSDSAATGKGLAAVVPADEEVLVTLERFEGSDMVEGLRIARSAPGDTMKVVAALNARDDVLYAEPNYLLHLEVTPNDPQFGQLYGMNLIGAQPAWDITQGNRNIVVAVIDEGIDINHQDLAANIWTNPSPGSIPGISGDLHGYDFRANTGTILAEPHATHVAGTVGAVGNNNTGVVGVNWQVSLMSLRFISDATNSGTEADAIKAYNYVKQMRDLWSSSGQTKGANIRVVNASYGGGGYSQASADAINALGQSGVLFVAAAGNETSDTDLSAHYPSSYSLPNVISVASTTSADTLSSFSNFGAHSVLMGAPGSGIQSTLPANSYGSLSGTSMATPHVAGAAALLCAANSNLSVSQLRALLAFNGDSVPALQGKTLTGRRLNVFKSLQAMNENDTTPPGAVGSLQVISQSGRSINLSWIASGDDGAAGQASLYDISFVDQSNGAVVPLTTVAPVASGVTQNLNVSLPYRHLAGTIRVREFDNVGNEGTPATVSVTVPLNAADPYTMSLNAAASLSTGGTALGLTFDDRYRENYLLPFPFPFFGQSYNQITISTNGNLYFSPPPKRSNGDADDVPSSIADLSLRKMISGMWDDLDLRTSRRPDADVYVVQPDSTRIIFRWQGVQFGDGTNGDLINFEIELRSDGTVMTRYGAGNTNLLPVVGISGGEPDPYVIDALTSESSPKNLTNAQSAVFAPRSSCNYALFPTSQTYTAAGGNAGVSVSTQNGCPWNAVSNAPWITITGGANGTGGGTVNYSVAANSVTTPRSATMTIAGLTFTVNQEAAPLPVIQLTSSSFSTIEGVDQVFISLSRTGDPSGTSTVNFTTGDTAGSQACSFINGAASARCDYVSTTRKFAFAPGETTRTFGVSIINDTYQEGNETFSVSISNPTGASLGQSTATVTIVDNDSANGTNPLTQTRFFVRQQYLDFLNREPDAPGFNFWVNNIDVCGADAGCREVRRVDTSASFFLSIEFKETGYLVERIYKAAYGDDTRTSSTGGNHDVIVPIIRLNEFLPDTQRIAEGVIVNQGNWQQQLEANKQAFTQEFVQRARFQVAFPLTMTAAQFVDKLNDNAKDRNGVRPLSATERDQLVNALNSQTMTRAQVLRVVAEDADLFNSEINRAFVLIEYFGFLRRDPNDAPEATLDYAGYEFWLNKLNQFNGNYINAELVKAFLSSIEYNQRFAP